MYLGYNNIPYVGEFLERDCQVRHYMRSSKDTPVHEVHRKSRDYIECNLKESWLLMPVAETDSKRPVALIEGRVQIHTQARDSRQFDRVYSAG